MNWILYLCYVFLPVGNNPFGIAYNKTLPIHFGYKSFSIGFRKYTIPAYQFA